ncbi:hypothetical protein [Paraburkholderia sp. BR10954]|uniref:hypothetical protein n=1 Tax=Paraburkholderia sp. BR10954 TaxID=3236995 RepID=UPI0034D18A84
MENIVVLENEIRQLESSVNTLVRRPTLMRREYWTAQAEKLLLLPGLSARDRHRLSNLLALIEATARRTGGRQTEFSAADADRDQSAHTGACTQP